MVSIAFNLKITLVILTKPPGLFTGESINLVAVNKTCQPIQEQAQYLNRINYSRE